MASTQMLARMLRFSFLFALAVAAGPAWADVATAPPLVSHKAVYDLNLVEGVGTKAPAGASGKISFEFSSACDGYAQTLRQIVEMQPQEGERQVTETRTSTYEDARGADFRFNNESQVGSGEEVDGRAERDARGALSVALSRPKPFKFNSDAEVFFPTQHIAKVIDAARRGDKVLLARVYDASDDGRKVFDVTAIIGKPATGPDRDKGARIPALQGLQRWPVALAYFDADQRDGTPDYVLSFNLYENGVSTGLKLDYGSFVLTGELMGIEFPPAAKCRH